MTPEEILNVEKDIVLTLKNIYDPEIPVNIYDLGLIYEIDYTPDGTATIRMTLTAPNCPMANSSSRTSTPRWPKSTESARSTSSSRSIPCGTKA